MAEVKNCGELLGLAMDHLNLSLSFSGESLNDIVDLWTWLSAAETYYETFIKGFDDINNVNHHHHLKTSIVDQLKNSTELTSNSLAIVTWISKVAGPLNLSRRLMSLDDDDDGRRELVENSEKLRKKADMVVAKEGGSYGDKYVNKSIGEALKAVPDKSKKRTLIYVKKGVYYENVRVEKAKWNVLMVWRLLLCPVALNLLMVLQPFPLLLLVIITNFNLVLVYICMI